MHFEKIHNKGQARLFQSQYMEMLTKTNPIVIWGMYIPIMGFMLYKGFNSVEISALKVSSIFVGGMLFWTLFEYIMHRFAFHHLAESQRAKKFVYIIHGNHHEYPRDKGTPVYATGSKSDHYSCIILAYYLIMGNFALFFFPGFVLGLPSLRKHALRHSRLEPSLPMDETALEKSPPASL